MKTMTSALEFGNVTQQAEVYVSYSRACLRNGS
jgi:hypothetical protein